MLRLLVLSVLPLGAVAAESGYVEKMIACSEAEERFVSQAYEAFLAVAGNREVKAGELRFPTHWAVARPEYIILSRAFYISPNELRGFELAIPKDCLAEKDGILSLISTLVLVKEDVRVGIRIFVLRRKNA